jgi:hypothetical protein
MQPAQKIIKPKPTSAMENITIFNQDHDLGGKLSFNCFTLQKESSDKALARITSSARARELGFVAMFLTPALHSGIHYPMPQWRK